jgi:ADP-ribosylglycohydrolase
MSEFENKIYGSILGLAIGDAFGAPVEFKARGSYPKVTDEKGEPHHSESRY